MTRFNSVLVAAALILAPALAQNASANSLADIYFKALEPSHFILTHQGYLIDWKVGDQAEYDISGGPMGKMGTMTKSVTKDEGETLWFRQDMKVMGRNEVVDAQIDKNTGEVLKLIRNGKEEQIPNDPLEIISQDYVQVTVPAGTFESIHIVANTKDIKNLEIWANPKATVMDGALKQIMPTQFFKLTIELTSFHRAN